MANATIPEGNTVGLTGSSSNRTFLGWDAPVLPVVTKRLWEQFRSANQWDLRKLLIVLPGRLAVRRLTELLEIEAEKKRCQLHLPEIITIGELPERFYVAKKPFASSLTQTLAWSAALQSAPIADLRILVPNPPSSTAVAQWFELAETLADLHGDLASDCLDFGMVENALGKNHIECPRWRALKKIQRRYLDELTSLGLWDIHTARLKALEQKQLPTDRQVIVVGCIDLNRIQRGFIKALAPSAHIWIAAPENLALSFDPQGCLDAEQWHSQLIELPADSLLVGNTPSDQAELVTTSIVDLAGDIPMRQVTLGVADSDLIPELRHRLSQSSIMARFGPGEPLTRSQPAALLALISNFLEDRSYSAFAALVRHPAVESLLLTEPHSVPADWLTQLDDYYQEALPAHLDDFVSEQLPSDAEYQTTVSVYRQLKKAVSLWLKPLEQPDGTASDWAMQLRGVLLNAFNHLVPLDLPDQFDCDPKGKLTQSIQAISDAISKFEQIPAKLQPRMSFKEFTDWLLQSISGQLIPEPHDPESIEMLGWLELAWDDSPGLVLAGLHDGVVPESVSADAFLPNQLRRQLGMLDNSRRLARDVYLMKLIQSSRLRLRIIAGKSDAAGNPLVPSRLLLACDLKDLPARVLHLVQEENTDVLPTVELAIKPVQGRSKLVVPKPQAVTAPTYITVTAFRDYLRCPYRFYLRHVERLRGKSDIEVELDAAKFGNLIHDTLERLATSPVSDSSDADEIAEFLKQQLWDVAANRFGPDPHATTKIQIEQAGMRLSALALQQATRAAEGWRIRYTERGSQAKDRILVGKNKELCLVGRIDRIDYHPETGKWAIWDYKTSDTAKNPVSVHHNERDGWMDLQLPLYIPIARMLGVTGNPSVGYIALPKQPEDVGFFEAEFDQSMLEEAWAKADEIATRVANCEFWPESIQPVDYDDFTRICQIQSQQVTALPPRPKLFRFDGYRKQQVRAETVAKASQRLENPASRTTIRLDPLLIRASAGTGKTFQLTNRLLQILLAGNEVDGILATTFTRKAAGEILQRVLQRLALGCVSEEDQARLAEQLPGVDCSADNCLATLRRVTISIHRLRIGTLDSFFSQLSRTFSLEMGLPAGWTIMEPNRESVIQMQAISNLLQKNEHKTALDLVRMLFKGESSRRLSEDILSAVNGGLGLYRCSSEEAWDRLPLLKPPGASECQEALRSAESCRLPDNRIKTALDKLIASFLASDWMGILTNGLVVSLKHPVPTYYRKELPGELISVLELLRDKAIAEILPVYQKQTLATYQILHSYEQSYLALLRRSRTLAFADVTYFLAQWLNGKLADSIAKAELPRIEYRLDCGIDHLLLDEFQDTSMEQWEILRPLAQPLGRDPESDRSLSERSFFCVGDSKQAIYGWRGGVAEIFDVVNQSIQGLESRDLAKSYRSSLPIMKAVNEVFQNLDRHPNFGDCDQTAREWQTQFPHHETEKKLLSGYVLLENGPAVDDKELSKEEKRLNFLGHAVDRVAQLVRQSTASVGILVRTNDDVGRIISMLRNRNIAASQDGGNPLTDSPAVELILSLLHLADHPGDTICSFHIANSPLLQDWQFAKELNPSQLGRWFAGCVSSIGLGRTIELVAEPLAGWLSWWDRERVEQLIRMAHEYEVVGGRLRDFEQFVESHRVALPTESQVKVMTIHKSKGLEFDAVFLPSLDSSLTGSVPQFITRRTNRCETPDGVLRYMSSELQEHLPSDWQQAFQSEKSGRVYESLCNLYVAMTRARRALYMTTYPGSSKPRQDLGSLLQSTLAAGSKAVKEPNTVLYRQGDEQWYAAESAGSLKSHLEAI